jgi:hypothetical protein
MSPILLWVAREIYLSQQVPVVRKKEGDMHTQNGLEKKKAMAWSFVQSLKQNCTCCAQNCNSYSCQDCFPEPTQVAKRGCSQLFRHPQCEPQPIQPSTELVSGCRSESARECLTVIAEKQEGDHHSFHKWNGSTGAYVHISVCLCVRM